MRPDSVLFCHLNPASPYLFIHVSFLLYIAALFSFKAIFSVIYCLFLAHIASIGEIMRVMMIVIMMGWHHLSSHNDARDPNCPDPPNSGHSRQYLMSDAKNFLPQDTFSLSFYKNVLFSGNSPEMYLCWIDHHLCWVCKEDKLLWTGPPSIVKFSVAVTQRLTSCGEEISRRDLILTNASAPGETSANQRPILGDLWPMRGQDVWQIICQLLSDSLVHLCHPEWGHTPPHIISLNTLTLNQSIIGSQESVSRVLQMQMIINADNFLPP